MMIVNGEIEFAPVYFNSATKSLINHWVRLESFFQYILHMSDVRSHNGAGWNVELIQSQYINNSTYIPWSGSFYINWPVEIRSPEKGVINIKEKDRKYLFWWHVTHNRLWKKKKSTDN